MAASFDPSRPTGSIARRPKGTPVGGQFAHRHHPESTTELSDEGIARAINKATRASNALARRYGLDADDLRQDTLLAYVTQVHKSGEETITNPNGYIETIARKHAVSSMMGTNRTEVRQALAAFNARINAEAQLAGRDLTAEERDVIAEQVRQAQKPGRRAPEGFHRPIRHLPLDTAIVGDLVDEGTPATGRGFEPTSVAAKAERLLAEGKRVEARRLAWDAIAEGHGAPLVAVGTISEVAATNARRTVSEAGGVVAIVDATPPDAPLSPEAQAVLAPFGAISQLDQDRVFDLLTTYPAVADQLWETALSRATVARSNKKAVA